MVLYAIPASFLSSLAIAFLIAMAVGAHTGIGTFLAVLCMFVLLFKVTYQSKNEKPVTIALVPWVEARKAVMVCGAVFALWFYWVNQETVRFGLLVALMVLVQVLRFVGKRIVRQGQALAAAAAAAKAAKDAAGPNA